MTRVEVRSSVLSCTRCDLHRSSNGPVPFRGPDNPRLAIVAEAPGKVENETKKPLVGPSGIKVSEWLERAHIPESDVAFLNAVSCYPARTPSPQEVELCKVNLTNQLSYLSPEFLLVMGGVALSSFWSGLRMGDARGLWWKAVIANDTEPNTWSIATYHPAAVLRNPSLDGLVMRDIMQVRLAMTLSDRESTKLPRPPSTHPYPKCLMCGDWLAVIRNMTGKELTNLRGVDAEGGLSWCAKHDGLRMGTAGQGRTSKRSESKSGGRGSSSTPRRRAARSTKLSTGSTDGNQTSINIEKYRIR